MKKFLLFLLVILLFSNMPNHVVTAQESDAKEEVSDKKEDAAEEEFNVRDFRNPFLTWLPLAIFQKAEGPEADIAVITEDAEGFIETIMPEEEIIPPDLIIQGLIWNTDFPQAIVNNTIVTVGDIIDEAEILDINREGIMIKYKEKEFPIKVQLFIEGSE